MDRARNLFICAGAVQKNRSGFFYICSPVPAALSIAGISLAVMLRRIAGSNMDIPFRHVSGV